MILYFEGEPRADNVRTATSAKDKILGLLFRTHMLDNEALFFPHINAIHTFGMKMNIDVLFLREEAGRLEIVDAYHDVRPMRSLRSRTADHTLELAGGALKRFGSLPKYVELRDA